MVRFYVRRNTKVAVVDYLDTYTCVVQLWTIQMMIILSLVLYMKTKQQDYTNAFFQAPLNDD